MLKDICAFAAIIGFIYAASIWSAIIAGAGQ